MADAEKETIRKLGKLVEAFRENQAKGYELLEEMQRLVAGGPGTAALLKRVEGAFERAWATRYPGRYIWNYKIDRPAIKRLLAKLTPEEIESRMPNYIANGDAFYLQNRHEFRLFASQINRFADPSQVSELELEGAAPADCKHTPRCKTDVEHTRRRRQENG